MNVKASVRSTMILAAGLFLYISAPLQAAENSDGGTSAATERVGAPVALNKFTRHRHQVKTASLRRKAVKLAFKPSAAKRAEKTKRDEVSSSDDKPSLALSPSIANAHAQLAAADISGDSAIALTSQARDRLQVLAANEPEPQANAKDAGSEVVAADELNELDRAAGETAPTQKPALPPTVTMAMAQAPASVSSSDSAWDQTSLIGKIFIGFGALLTLASAVRMLMA